jgi:hypothetical protein
MLKPKIELLLELLKREIDKGVELPNAIDYLAILYKLPKRTVTELEKAYKVSK